MDVPIYKQVYSVYESDIPLGDGEVACTQVIACEGHNRIEVFVYADQIGQVEVWQGFDEAEVLAETLPPIETMDYAEEGGHFLTEGYKINIVSKYMKVKFTNKNGDQTIFRFQVQIVP